MFSSAMEDGDMSYSYTWLPRWKPHLELAEEANKHHEQDWRMFGKRSECIAYDKCNGVSDRCSDIRGRED